MGERRKRSWKRLLLRADTTRECERGLEHSYVFNARSKYILQIRAVLFFLKDRFH
jgi:hypothetical protein